MTNSSPTDPIELLAVAADEYESHVGIAKSPFHWTHEARRLIDARAAISSMPTIAGDEERAAIVAFLRSKGGAHTLADADAIERGDHLQTLSPEHIRRGIDNG